MSDLAEIDRRPLLRQLMWAGVMVALMIIALLIVWARPDNNRAMKPNRPAPTRVQLVIDAQPLLVTFDELNNNPNNYVGQRLRVNGDFTRLSVPACLHRSGPVFHWALVSGALQLDVLGYEALARLIPEDTPMTIEGFWRRYSGPSGCGKKPPTAHIWYLEVTQIVQPNPLPDFVERVVDASPDLSDEPLPLETPPSQVEAPAASLPPTPTPSADAYPSPQERPTAVTPGAASPTAVAPGTTLTPTPTSTPRVAATLTPTSGAPGTTATPPAGGFPTPTTFAVTPPALPSPTLPAGGYPPPPGGYP